TVPVRHRVDVFIAGGVPAGIAATVAATGQGASVFLAEGQSCFGGMGPAALVPALMRFGDGANFLAGGGGRRVYDLMWERGAVSLHDDREKSAHSSPGIQAAPPKRTYADLIGGSGSDRMPESHTSVRRAPAPV
ncbi:MAG: FAD-dependent oxidoreductase, partial [Armatimonadetes bacterium]|nr:FAD-dependent oxidoreductase [Armatimonadota bacterium]